MTSDYKGWFLEFLEDWSQFLEPCNWRTFRFAFFEVEDDRIMGGVEMTFIVLGIGFRARWNYCETEQVTDIQEKVEAIERGDITLDDSGITIIEHGNKSAFLELY